MGGPQGYGGGMAGAGGNNGDGTSSGSGAREGGAYGAGQDEKGTRSMEMPSVKITKLRAAVAEDPNPQFRPAMEDAFIIRDSFGGDNQWGYYGVYDGHGGRQVVDYTLANLHEIFLQELRNNG